MLSRGMQPGRSGGVVEGRQVGRREALRGGPEPAGDLGPVSADEGPLSLGQGGAGRVGVVLDSPLPGDKEVDTGDAGAGVGKVAEQLGHGHVMGSPVPRSG
jgi:hypothetical protein